MITWLNLLFSKNNLALGVPPLYFHFQQLYMICTCNLWLLNCPCSISPTLVHCIYLLKQDIAEHLLFQSLLLYRSTYISMCVCLLYFNIDPSVLCVQGDDLVYGICGAIDGEKDPRCLMLTFHIVEILARLFPDPSGPLASFAGDLFDILGCYFPIHFTHVSVMNTSCFNIYTYLSYFLAQKGKQDIFVRFSLFVGGKKLLVF